LNLKNHDFARHRSPGGPRKVPVGRFLLAGIVVFAILKCWNPEPSQEKKAVVKEELKKVLAKEVKEQAETKAKLDTTSKTKAPVKLDDLGQWAKVQPDSALAYKVGTYLKRYHPKGAVYLMVDGKSNQPLAWGQWSDSTLQNSSPYITQSTFPAASIIKTLAAGAALESGRYSNHTPIPQKGRYHTLYKSQLKVPSKYNGETLTLETAYAKSANPPFGIIGQNLGGDYMKEVAGKMGFNRTFAGNKPFLSEFNPPSNGYELAEAACGFTKSNTLSPLLAAAFSRSILTGKDLEIPYHENNYAEFPSKALKLEDTKLKENTYFGLKKMMETTSVRGTSSRLLRRNLFRYVRKRLVIGSKTGTLDGDNPEGRYDWFVGWAYDKKDPDKSVVIVLMQIQDEKRTLGTSAVAALLLNDWHKLKLSDKP
jgi:peptidoglycan glycosyltransferase